MDPLQLDSRAAVLGLHFQLPLSYLPDYLDKGIMKSEDHLKLPGGSMA